MRDMDEFLPDVEGVNMPLLYALAADCADCEVRVPVVRWLVSRGIQPPKGYSNLRWWMRYVDGDKMMFDHGNVAFNPMRWYFLPPEGKTVEELIPEYWVGEGECPA